MANHKSAEKRVRQTEKRTVRNRATKAKIRTVTKKATDAIAAKDTKAITENVSKAAKLIQKAATKKVLHKNTAARRQSRLAKAANKASK